MTTQQISTWLIIDGAANANPQFREEFVRRYYPIVQRYLLSRWGRTRRIADVDDACQEVFIECLKVDGPLTRVDRHRLGSFRRYLFGITRNVARRFEQRESQNDRVQDGHHLDRLATDEMNTPQIIDRDYAVKMISNAMKRQSKTASSQGREAMMRAKLLRLRFFDGLPIRRIARLWNEDATRLHRQYTKAREEFRRALREVLMELSPPRSHASFDRSCHELLELLR